MASEGVKRTRPLRLCEYNDMAVWARYAASWAGSPPPGASNDAADAHASRTLNATLCWLPSSTWKLSASWREVDAPAELPVRPHRCRRAHARCARVSTRALRERLRSAARPHAPSILECWRAGRPALAKALAPRRHERLRSLQRRAPERCRVGPAGQGEAEAAEARVGAPRRGAAGRTCGRRRDRRRERGRRARCAGGAGRARSRGGPAGFGAAPRWHRRAAQHLLDPVGLLHQQRHRGLLLCSHAPCTACVRREGRGQAHARRRRAMVGPPAAPAHPCARRRAGPGVLPSAAARIRPRLRKSPSPRARPRRAPGRPMLVLVLVLVLGLTLALARARLALSGQPWARCALALLRRQRALCSALRQTRGRPAAGWP